MQFSPDENGSGNRHWELSVRMLRTPAGEPIKFRVPHPTMHTLVLWTAAANLSQGIADRFEIAAVDVLHIIVLGVALIVGRRLARTRSDRTPRIIGAVIGGMSLVSTLVAGGKLWSAPGVIGAAMFLINVIGLLCSLRTGGAKDAGANGGNASGEDSVPLLDTEAVSIDTENDSNGNEPATHDVNDEERML
jgi:hypothetical protein